jgi:hypothetical protein
MTFSSGQGTRSIGVSWTANAIDASIYGPIEVVVSNVCTSYTVTAQVSLATIAPITPGSVSGPTRLCPGDTAVYSVSPVGRAVYYNWQLPQYMVFVGSNTTSNVITVRVLPQFTGGTVTVSAGNACGDSGQRSRTVSSSPPAAPGAVNGQRTGLCDTDSVLYFVTSPNPSVSYIWTAPPGATITSGQGNDSIYVTYGFSGSGTFTVVAVNNCGTSAVRSFTVSVLPDRPGLITAGAPPCIGTTVSYSIQPVLGALQYNWLVTSGGTIVGTSVQKNVSIAWSGIPSSQTMTVRAVNACGLSTARVLTLNTIICTTRMDDQLSGDLDLLIYPNPTAGSTILRFTTDNEARYTIRILDLAGKLLQNREGESLAGENILDLDFGAYPSGMYMVEVESDGLFARQRVVVE